MQVFSLETAWPLAPAREETQPQRAADALGDNGLCVPGSRARRVPREAEAFGRRPGSRRVLDAARVSRRCCNNAAVSGPSAVRRGQPGWSGNLEAQSSCSSPTCEPQAAFRASRQRLRARPRRSHQPPRPPVKWVLAVLTGLCDRSLCPSRGPSGQHQTGAQWEHRVGCSQAWNAS